MSMLKAELKQLITNEIGVRIEDSLEAAKRDLAVTEGRQGGFLDGMKVPEALLIAVDKDVEEGKFDLPTAELVKRYLIRASSGLQNLSQQTQNFVFAQKGKVQGLEQTVKLLKNMADQEREKVEALKTAEILPPAENPRERPLGARPVSIKELRLAEEEKQAEAVQEAEEAPLEETPVPVKKKRGRKPRGSNA